MKDPHDKPIMVRLNAAQNAAVSGLASIAGIPTAVLLRNLAMQQLQQMLMNYGLSTPVTEATISNPRRE